MELQVHSFLTSALDGSEWSASRRSRTATEQTANQLNRRLLDLQSRYRHYEEKKNLLALSEIERRFLSFPAVVKSPHRLSHPNCAGGKQREQKCFKLINHHHISFMELGHLLTRSGLTYPEVFSKVYHDSFCQMGNSIPLPWVIYFEAFYLHAVSSFSSIPVICPKLVLFLTPLQFVHLFCNLSKCILLFFSCI